MPEQRQRLEIAGDYWTDSLAKTNLVHQVQPRDPQGLKGMRWKAIEQDNQYLALAVTHAHTRTHICIHMYTHVYTTHTHKLSHKEAF